MNVADAVPASPMKNHALEDSSQPAKKRKTYKELMKEAEESIAQLSTCDDVDEAMHLFRKGNDCLRDAEQILKDAEGEIKRLTS